MSVHHSPKGPMRLRRYKIDMCGISNNTYLATERAKATLERAAILNGAEEAERKADGFCAVCYKAGRVGGAMCCAVVCAVCPTVMHFGSTNTDRLCKPCALKHGLCRHCAGDLDMKQRRKPHVRPEDIQPAPVDLEDLAPTSLPE